MISSEIFLSLNINCSLGIDSLSTLMMVMIVKFMKNSKQIDSEKYMEKISLESTEKLLRMRLASTILFLHSRSL